MSGNSKSRHAEIAGGGIGGLSMGILLARKGWSVTVHERMPEIREIGAGLVLHHTSLVVFEELGLLEGMVEGAVAFDRSSMRDRRGKELWGRELGHVSRSFNPMRQAVIRELADAAESAGVEVLTGSNVERIEPEGVLVTDSGEVRGGDLVVAADGFHSRLRDALGLTDVKRSLASGCTRTVIPRGEFDSEDAFIEYWSGHRRMGICPTSDDLTYVYLACPLDDERGSRLPLDTEYWQAAFPALPDEFVERLGQGEPVRHPYAYVRCKSWSSGRVAVIGDAAHALPPTLGQGVGLTVSNVRALVDAMERESDIPAALAHWEQSYRKVTDTTQRWSLLYESLCSRWPESLELGRVWFMRGLRKIKIEDRMEVANRAADELAARLAVPAERAA
jgi:2-polyprenyl-6-methoxyphenol hydroxylase-like FAD-dependent oxidoreductase